MNIIHLRHIGRTAGLSFFLVGLLVVPVFGQPANARERAGLVERLEAEEAVRADELDRWIRSTGARRRISKPGGGHIEIVSVRDGWLEYLETHNIDAARTTRTASLRPGGRLGVSLTGENLVIGVWDSGHALSSHREFGDRLIEGDDSLPDDHATHVSGTIGAAGFDPRATGMAVEAVIRSYDWQSDASEMARAALFDSLLISNHSYGPMAGWEFDDVEGTGTRWYWVGDTRVDGTEDANFGRYNGQASSWDAVAASNPYYLPVVSAGNHRGDRGPSSGSYRIQDPVTEEWTSANLTSRPIPQDGGEAGFDTMVGSALGKNVLTVGSVGDRLSESSPVRVSNFSSFGPADDGRVKPDVVANGESLLSTVASGNDQYGRLTGTSMSAPNVSGSLLLLQQYFRQMAGRFMKAASVKGLAIHAAEDTGEPGPDYRSGWGLFDAEAAALHIRQATINKMALLETVLLDGETVAFDVIVAESGPVRCTLSWTDVRSFTSATVRLDDPTPALKNDLDIRLIALETGRAYLPYVLDGQAPEEPAGTGDNTVDNVEQIFASEVPEGRYRVVVSHKNTLVSRPEQAFSLFVSGAVDQVRTVALTNFTVSFALEGTRLVWSTSFETGPGRFVVERAALRRDADGQETEQEFVPIVSIPMQGIMGGGTDYLFVDPSPPPGRHTYRLLVVDPDGSEEVLAFETILVPSALFNGLSVEADLSSTRLRWETLFELAQGSFAIERRRFGLNDSLAPAESVGNVPGVGPSRAVVSYTFEDLYAPAGRYEYVVRFTLEAADVSAEISAEVLVPVPERLQILSVYPNPVDDRVRIVVDLPMSGRIRVEIYDILGRTVSRLQDEAMLASRLEFEVQTGNWTPGIYVVRVVSETGTTTRTMAVAR